MQNDAEFIELLWRHYDTYGRHDLPWRQTVDPYAIMVSEIMLQQTQVSRVIPKFTAFMQRFPTITSLAQADLGEVLVMWSGLGYNRRAKYLWQAANQVQTQSGGRMPDTPEGLVALPGVGVNTAGAILAYAYNYPSIFIETNVRSVYIHHYFAETADDVSDAQIKHIVERTLDTEQPRQFYWAIMDYGTHLKQTAGNASRRSAHYVKQSPFKGSKRQVRGAVLKQLAHGPASTSTLAAHIPDARLEEVLNDLCAEQLIKKANQHYSL